MLNAFKIDSPMLYAFFWHCVQLLGPNWNEIGMQECTEWRLKFCSSPVMHMRIVQCVPLLSDQQIAEGRHGQKQAFSTKTLLHKFVTVA